VIQILGYDSSAVYNLTLAQTPAWLQQTGSWLWLHATAASGSDLEEIGCLFNLHPHQLDDSHQRVQGGYVEAGHRYVFARLPFRAEEQDSSFQIFLGRNYLLSFNSAPEKAVDAIAARYQTEARLWTHGPDHLMQLLIGAVVDLTAGAVEKLESKNFARAPLPPDSSHYDAQERLLLLRCQLADQSDVVSELAQLELDLIDANVRHRLHLSRRRLAGLRRYLQWRQLGFERQMQTAIHLEVARVRSKIEQLALLVPLLQVLIVLLLLAIVLALVVF
jgi:Mg2+ and Co2+ transporter CorA